MGLSSQAFLVEPGAERFSCVMCVGQDDSTSPVRIEEYEVDFDTLQAKAPRAIRLHAGAVPLGFGAQPEQDLASVFPPGDRNLVPRPTGRVPVFASMAFLTSWSASVSAVRWSSASARRKRGNGSFRSIRYGTGAGMPAFSSRTGFFPNRYSGITGSLRSRWTLKTVCRHAVVS